MKATITYTQLDHTDKKIIALLAEGDSAKDIAAKTGYSDRTIENKIQAMLTFYNCKNRIQLVIKMIKVGEYIIPKEVEVQRRHPAEYQNRAWN